MNSYFNPVGHDVMVVEKEIIEDCPNDSTYFYVYAVTAFVYAFFVALLVDRLLKYEDVEKVCKGNNSALCLKAEKAFNNKKFIYMMILGVFSVFSGAYIAGSNPGLRTGGISVCAGGAMLLLYYTVLNWSNIDKNVQLAILGTTFFTLFYGSTKMNASE